VQRFALRSEEGGEFSVHASARELAKGRDGQCAWGFWSRGGSRTGLFFPRMKFPSKDELDSVRRH